MKRGKEKHEQNRIEMSTRHRLSLSVQYPDPRLKEILTRQKLRRWIGAALQMPAEITLRFVDAEEGLALNRDYRGKDYATNVLSFPYESEPIVCGDLVICAPVVEREAAEQGKELEAHYAHLIVHGILHLQAYDHEAGEQEAQLMESHERALLTKLGFADPYAGEALE